MRVRYRGNKIVHNALKFNNSISVVIPIHMVKALGIEAGDEVLIEMKGNKIILEKGEKNSNE